MVTGTELKYEEIFGILNNGFDQSLDKNEYTELDAEITHHKFKSDTEGVFDGTNEYETFDPVFKALLKFYLERNEHSDETIFSHLEQKDETVEVNKNFRYSIVSYGSKTEYSSAIIMLHGLNEKSWQKYLPWAYELSRNTGKPVILFPTAFHINRAPEVWSDFRKMKRVADERQNLFPNAQEISFANAAISTRLQFVPRRFLLSGLQTYRDIVKLAGHIKSGGHPLFKKSSSIDFFAYSIGAFLAEILLMSDQDSLFEESRLFIFCGGSTLDEMTPVAKAILDSGAAEAMYRYYITDYEKNAVQDPWLRNFLNSKKREADIFTSMLAGEKGRKQRESILKKIGGRIYSLGLMKDEIIGTAGMLKTLASQTLKNRIRTKVKDFIYPYTHVNPFPSLKKFENEIAAEFTNTFRLASDFLV